MDDRVEGMGDNVSRKAWSNLTGLKESNETATFWEPQDDTRL